MAMPNQKLMSMQQAAVSSASTMSPIAFTLSQNGVTIIVPGSPLTRLNYFDGKFLRAVDLQTEQAYLRTLVELSNQAGGPGVAYGFTASLASSGTEISLDAGLAIDPTGQVLLLSGSQTVSIPDLLANNTFTQSVGVTTAGADFADCVAITAATGTAVVAPSNLYLLVIAHAEAFCGSEDVFGKLCQEACITSTDRPYAVEGIVVRLLPLTLATPLPTSKAVTLGAEHLRSRVASAYFEDERNLTGSLISKPGLQSTVWCAGAEGAQGIYVPLGVVGWTGTAASFFDSWTGRRERMDTPAKRYWQWRIRMRPWDVFMAQILQFQCQLRDGLQTGPTVPDPCKDTRTLVAEASTTVAELLRYYQTASEALATANITSTGLNLAGGTASVTNLMQRFSQAQSDAIIQVLDRLLIRQGIIELPSAGYLPVTPGDAVSVNQQVRQWMGEGVNLRFCIVTPDYVQHALEEAQHMERISLIAGIDDPQATPDMDILVPNGKVIQPKLTPGTAYQARLIVGGLTAGLSSLATGVNPAASIVIPERQLTGAAYIDVPPTGKVQAFTAVDSENASPSQPESSSTWIAATCNPNPFNATAGGQALLDLRFVSADLVSGNATAEDILLNGNLQFGQLQTVGSTTLLQGVFTGTMSLIRSGMPEQTGRTSLSVKALLTTIPNQAPSLEVQVIDLSNKQSFTFRASWSGSPRQIVATFAREALRAMAAEFTQSDDVVQPTNVWHAAALKALDNIGQAITDPQFSSVSAALLFPPPPPPTSDLQVEATLDWVLFQRRRTKQCHVETVTTPVPSRRYQLWHGLVANQSVLPAVIAALRNGTPLATLKDDVAFQKVDIPEFAPGIATLVTQQNTIQTDWTNVKPGQELDYGGIASSDAAKVDGNTLALARLNQLEQAIESISRPVTATITEVLDAIHPDLAVPGVDGTIVVLTILHTVCHSVYAVTSSQLLQEAIRLIAAGQIATVFTQGMVKPLGAVTFKADASDVEDQASLQSVIDKWNLLKLAAPASAATVYLTSDTEPAIRAAQGNAILKALGSTTSTTGFATNTLTTEIPCPAATFVAPPGVTGAAVLVHAQADAAPGQTRTARLVPWRGSFLNRTIVDLPAPAFVSFAADGSLVAELPAEVITALQKVSAAFTSVELVPSEAQPDAEAQKRLDNIADALLQAKLIQPTASRQITKIRTKETQLLTVAGINANEIVFLRVG
jgi:hypothetical protein